MPGDPPLCVRCNRPVEVSGNWYVVFEMHWICFHYEFEHEGDPDAPCADLACPGRPDAAYPPEEDGHMRRRVEAARRARRQWIEAGAPWREPAERRPGCKLERQLPRIPSGSRDPG